VPFTGGAPAANALIGGQIDYMLNDIVDVGQQVQAGTIKAYAIAAPERHPALPNVPTTLEARALDDDNVRMRLADVGGTIPANAKRGQQPLAALVKSEIARWTPIIEAAKTKAAAAPPPPRTSPS